MFSHTLQAHYIPPSPLKEKNTPRQCLPSILTPGKHPLRHPRSEKKKKNSLIRSTEIKTVQKGSRRSTIKKGAQPGTTPSLTPPPSISERLIMETKRQTNYIPIARPSRPPKPWRSVNLVPSLMLSLITSRKRLNQTRANIYGPPKFPDD